MDCEETPAVGIDLGMTYSCVGVWWNNDVVIIPNELGNHTTPSCVAFTDCECLIGEGALNQTARNLTNTIFDAKRLIGRRFSEESVQSDRKLWPFKVISGEADKPTIVVNHMKQEKHYTAEEISAMVLSKMKETASKFVGSPVKKAVVTVPAYFNNSQRQATKDAAAIADLDVLQILDEPIAATLAYSLDNKDSCLGGKKMILVFNLGVRTLEVSLVQLDQHGVLQVKVTCVDTHLGGDDFDNRMVDHLLKIWQERYKEDLSKNYKCVQRLKTACERAKRGLSSQRDTHICIDSFYDDDDFIFHFSKARFEDINKDLFDKCMGPVQQCLQVAHVHKNSVDEVVLVGGSTRIPMIQEMLRNFFEGKVLYRFINVEKVVAHGASIQAAILNGDKSARNATNINIANIGTVGRSLVFEYRMLERATNNFAKSNLLGRGGFGPVYKGKLSGGEEIAVKKLEGGLQGIEELETEVKIVTKLRHKNLVRVLGYCLEGEEAMLVYEFLANSSLDRFIKDRQRCERLTWSVRFKIIKGITRGLHYLHVGSDVSVVHRDLKTGNILLDADMNPKISDFGLARLFDDGQTRAFTMNVAGTLGYIPPEFRREGLYSLKGDIYSFGIVVLEIITGKFVNSFGHVRGLVDYVIRPWNAGKPLEVLDSRLGGVYSPDEVTTSIYVGLLCTQENRNKRPEMEAVVGMLSNPQTMSQISKSAVNYQGR